MKRFPFFFAVFLAILVGGIMITVLSQNTAASIQNTKTSVLTSHLESGSTTLRVRDLETMKGFYQEVVGLEVTHADQTEVRFAKGGREILRLISAPDLPPQIFGSAGLYHNAVVFASRAELAQTLEHIFSTEPHRFQGSSDHRVSEAFYFADPEGNGLELYFDKDRSTWEWKDGRVVMGSSYIDPQRYIATHGTTSGDPTAKMGHVHLKVGDIEEAKAFYVEKLGLTIVAETPGALFVSDGIYHHNIGLNVWESAGAGPREETLGLGEIELLVAQPEDLQKLSARLTQASYLFETYENTLRVSDPWGNTLVVKVQ